jgi:hypothetical protein
MFWDLKTGLTIKIVNTIRKRDVPIIIESIVSSDKKVINPKSIDKSKIVIPVIPIKIRIRKRIFFVNDLINCDALELYCVRISAELLFILSSILSLVDVSFFIKIIKFM